MLSISPDSFTTQRNYTYKVRMCQVSCPKKFVPSEIGIMQLSLKYFSYHATLSVTCKLAALSALKRRPSFVEIGGLILCTFRGIRFIRLHTQDLNHSNVKKSKLVWYPRYDAPKLLINISKKNVERNDCVGMLLSLFYINLLPSNVPNTPIISSDV